MKNEEANAQNGKLVSIKKQGTHCVRYFFIRSGIQIQKQTINTIQSFRYIGQTPLYELNALLAWIEAQPVFNHTSEKDKSFSPINTKSLE